MPGGSKHERVTAISTDRAKDGTQPPSRYHRKPSPNYLAHRAKWCRSPGSLLRTQIVYEVACAYGGRDEQAQDMAVAIEYFHNASLLVDGGCSNVSRYFGV